MFQNNPPDSNSTFAYPPMSPTVPFFPRHFYPMGYMQEVALFPESGRPIPDSEKARPSWPFTVISLGVYLLLGLLTVSLILWSNRQPAPEHTRPATPEVQRILASHEAIPHPPYSKRNGINSPGSQQGKPSGVYTIRSVSSAQQQRYPCQWLGLERV